MTNKAAEKTESNDTQKLYLVLLPVYDRGVDAPDEGGDAFLNPANMTFTFRASDRAQAWARLQGLLRDEERVERLIARKLQPTGVDEHMRLDPDNFPVVGDATMLELAGFVLISENCVGCGQHDGFREIEGGVEEIDLTNAESNPPVEHIPFSLPRSEVTTAPGNPPSCR